MLQVVTLVHDHEVEFRKRAADCAREVVLESLLGSQVKNLVFQPGQFATKVVALLLPLIGVRAQSEAERSHAQEEIAPRVHAHFVDEIGEVVAHDDRPRRATSG